MSEPKVAFKYCGNAAIMKDAKNENTIQIKSQNGNRGSFRETKW